MLLKDVLSKETFNDLEKFMDSHEDAISLLAKKGTTAEEIVTRFQTLANPNLIGEVKPDFKSSSNGSPSTLMLNIPKFTNGYSSFALREDNSHTGEIRYPLVGSYATNKKYFAENEIVCPNFKDIIKNIETSFKIKIQDDAKSLGNKSLVKGRKVYVNDGVAEANKLVAVLNVFAKKLNKKFGRELNSKEISNNSKLKTATEILTTMFLCQCFDMGQNSGMKVSFNEKVNHALRLQLSNVIASMGNVSNSKNFEVMTKVAEKSVGFAIKKLGITIKDIENIRLNRLGLESVEEADSLHSLLFGNVLYINRFYLNDNNELCSYYDYPTIAEKTKTVDFSKTQNLKVEEKSNDLEEVEITPEDLMLLEKSSLKIDDSARMLEAPSQVLYTTGKVLKTETEQERRTRVNSYKAKYRKAVVEDKKKKLLEEAEKEEKKKLYHTKKVISTIGLIRDKKAEEERKNQKVITIKPKKQIEKISKEEMEKAYYGLLEKTFETRRKSVKNNDAFYTQLTILLSYAKDTKKNRPIYKGKDINIIEAEELFEKFEQRKDLILEKVFGASDNIDIQSLEKISGSQNKPISSLIKNSIENVNGVSETKEIREILNLHGKEIAKRQKNKNMGISK